MRSQRSLISRPDRGTTLIELVITMAMLGILTLLLFGAFEVGTRVFRDTTVRQSSENQLRAIKLLFERDANLTNIWYCKLAPRTVTVGTDTLNRDGIALCSMNNWKDAGNYDTVTLRPMWNRYLVWYASTETPNGKLYRQVVEPPAVAGGFTTPYDALLSNINNDPDSNANVVYTRILSEDVLDFRNDISFQNGTVTASIRLQAKGAQRPGTLSKTEENLQVDFTFQPKNSWPKI